MRKYAKAIVAFVLLVVSLVANAMGLDLGELGANVDTGDALEVILGTVLVYFVRNEDSGQKAEE